MEKIIHSLLGLIMDKEYYKQRYWIKFPTTTKPAVCDEKIPDNATNVDCAKAKAVYNANIADYQLFVAAKHETHNFILAVVYDIWVHELRDPVTFYTDISPSDLLDHLQKLCSGLHDLDVLNLQINCISTIWKWKASLSTSTRLRMPKSNPRGQAILLHMPPFSSSQPTPLFLLRVYPAPTKAGRNPARTRGIGTPGKLCTSLINRRPRSISRPSVAKTNLGHHMAYSISLLLLSSKPRVRTCRLMTSTNILTPSLWLLPLRRVYWRNWSRQMTPSLPPMLNCLPLWLPSPKPIISSIVRLETAATIAIEGIILRLASIKCAPISILNACISMMIVLRWRNILINALRYGKVDYDDWGLYCNW